MADLSVRIERSDGWVYIGPSVGWVYTGPPNELTGRSKAHVRHTVAAA